MDKKLKTADEVADLLSVSKQTIWRLCRGKKIPHHRVGANYRFSEADIRELLAVTHVDVEDDLPVPVGARR